MSSWYYFLYLYMLILTLFSHCYIENVQCFSHHYKLIWTFKTHWVESSTQSSWFIHNTLFLIILCLISPLLYKCYVSCKSLTTAYTNLGFNSSSLTLLVPMSEKCRLPSHHTFLCIFHSSPFFTKWILLEILMVCLVYLPLLAIHKYALLSNILRGACSGTTYG